MENGGIMKMYVLIIVLFLVIVSCKSPPSEPMKTGDIRNLGTSLSTIVATESTYVIINRSSGKIVSIIEKYGKSHYISPPKKVTK